MASELLNPTQSPEHPAAIDATTARTLARLARQVELGAAVAELSLSQYRVLSILDSGQEAASVLAEKLAVSRPALTGVVDGLVSRGLVARGAVHGDRRRVDVALTPAGARALALAEAEIAVRLTQIAELMPPQVPPAAATLAPWRIALDAYRKARHGGH